MKLYVTMAINERCPKDYCICRSFLNKKKAEKYIRKQKKDPQNQGYFWIIEESWIKL